MQFRDTVERVEKLCHSKRMHVRPILPTPSHLRCMLTETKVALSVWRDEARGLANDRPIDLSSDDEGRDISKTADNSSGHPPSEPLPSSGAASPITTSPIPTRPPSSASEHASVDDDFDIDAFIRSEADHAVSQPAPPASAPKAKHTYGRLKEHPGLTAEDETMWDELVGDEPVLAPTAKPPGAVPAERLFDEDEDMWDVVREMEKESPPPVTGTEQVALTNDDDWDEMYL